MTTASSITFTGPSTVSIQETDSGVHIIASIFDKSISHTLAMSSDDTASFDEAVAYLQPMIEAEWPVFEVDASLVRGQRFISWTSVNPIKMMMMVEITQAEGDTL